MPTRAIAMRSEIGPQLTIGIIGSRSVTFVPNRPKTPAYTLATLVPTVQTQKETIHRTEMPA